MMKRDALPEPSANETTSGIPPRPYADTVRTLIAKFVDGEDAWESAGALVALRAIPIEIEERDRMIDRLRAVVGRLLLCLETIQRLQAHASDVLEAYDQAMHDLDASESAAYDPELASQHRALVAPMREVVLRAATACAFPETAEIAARILAERPDDDDDPTLPGAVDLSAPVRAFALAARRELADALGRPIGTTGACARQAVRDLVTRCEAHEAGARSLARRCELMGETICALVAEGAASRSSVDLAREWLKCISVTPPAFGTWSECVGSLALLLDRVRSRSDV